MVTVMVRWAANPLRGDRFAEHWRPSAEAALRYGARSWALYRSLEGLHDFVQLATFDAKLDWERYWYSEEISAARTEAAGLFQVPVLPAYYEVVGEGQIAEDLPKGAAAPAAEGPGQPEAGALGPV